MPAGQPRNPDKVLGPRDLAELLCLAHGAPADARPRAARHRLRLEAHDLIRPVTSMAWNGREEIVGYEPTRAGRDVAARGRMAGGSGQGAPAEVAGAGGCIARSTPGHDHKQRNQP